MIFRHKTASTKRRFKRVLVATMCAMGVLALGLMMLPTRNRAESAPQTVSQSAQPNLERPTAC